jgi:hypothetical protein
MNLEQRVEDLEMQVQLLKGQIQTTLLDIQEMLLNRTYPALRGEETPVAAAPAPAPEVPAAPPAPASPVQRISLAQVDDDDDDEAMPDLSVFRKVNSYDAPPAPAVPAPKAGVPEREDWEEAVVNPREASSHDWIELENWVSQKVEKLGISRTRELINLYARQERFSTQECEILMQFVDIYDDSVPKPAATRHPAVPNKSTNGHTPQASMNGSSRPSIVPQTRAVVEEIRTELRQKTVQSSAHMQPGTEELSEQQGLVLRLIAGILNAGDTPSASNNGRRKR